MAHNDIERYQAQCDAMYEAVEKAWNASKNKAKLRKEIQESLDKLKASIAKRNRAQGHDPWEYVMALTKLDIPPGLGEAKLGDLPDKVELADVTFTLQDKTFQLTQMHFDHDKHDFDQHLNKQNQANDSTLDHSTSHKPANDTIDNLQRKPLRHARVSELRERRIKLVVTSENGSPLIIDPKAKKELVKKVASSNA